ncbi:hypothetical protein LO772_04410 [Yinghuangia sp. ASG 101]|uniref:hypothetical protein n=1 Tax=Yinghuangia sp. ASG 101 TaxID=2896848 RepID=UPI001E4C6D78|nr:hypothetical protein [Yinghuangia sp. ASG 101]UGQ12869.1 hypothetical protein LO772_04410 [Yinghuangia sp. ASG 101]
MENEPAEEASVAEVSARLRHRLIARLRADGHLRSPRVERAMAAVPREVFTPAGTDVAEAYADRVLVLASDASGAPLSTISQPAIVALMLEQLDVRAGQRILEIGTGSGYNTALLAELTGPGGRVTSVEVDAALVPGAAARLAELAPGDGTPLDLRHGDGWLGVPDAAPYDRLHSTIGVDDLPPAWSGQLADGGLLVAPLWLRPGLELSAALRRDGPLLRSVSVTPCGFLQLRGPHAPASHTRVLGPDLAVVGDSLGARDAELIRTLIDTPGVDRGPCPEPADPRWWGLSLTDPRAVLFVGPRSGHAAWGIYEPGGREGAGLALAHDGRVIGHGDPLAADVLRHRLDDAPPIDPSRLTITAYPATHPMPAPPRHGHTWRITRHHHIYRVHWAPTA